MKLRLKISKIQNQSMKLTLQLDEQNFEITINPVERSNELVPSGADYSVADVNTEYRFGVLMHSQAYSLLKNSSLLSIVLRDAAEYYVKHVIEKKRTAKREEIGFFLDSITWKFHKLRTLKHLHLENNTGTITL